MASRLLLPVLSVLIGCSGTAAPQRDATVERPAPLSDRSRDVVRDSAVVDRAPSSERSPREAGATDGATIKADAADASVHKPLTLTPGMVVSPFIAATQAKLTAGAAAGTFLDAPINALGGDYWLNSHSRGSFVIPDTVRHIMTHGGQADPYAAVLWAKPTCQRNAGQFCTDQTTGSHAFTSFGPGLTDVVQLWFTSIHNPGGAERLAFIHEENAGMTGFTPTIWEGRCRIGLAYSADSGNTWRYLGRLAVPHVDSGATRRQNIVGTPYVIHQNEFYVWYNDYDGTSDGLAVSRAAVASVLTAARAGHMGTGLWRKKTAAGWDASIQAAPAFPTGVSGVSHTHAAFSSTTGKYYVLLSMMNWGGQNTHVKLYELTTPDGPWTLAGSIVDEPGATNGTASGYQYCSLTDPSGYSNATITYGMNVTCRKLRDNAPPYSQALYQWTVYLVDLGADFYRASKDYSDVQGSRGWSYLTTGSEALTWNGSWWQDPGDTYNRIYRPGPGAGADMSPGATRGARLVWTAPKSGNVYVRALPRAAQPTPGCGDGVVVTYKVAGAVRKTATLAWNDTVGQSFTDNVAIIKGQEIELIVEKSGNNYCDGVFIDPTISYY